MKTRAIFSSIFVALSFCCFAQATSDLKVEKIDRQVKEYALDSINLSSPLNYFLSRAQVRLSGKFKNWGPISTSMFDYTADVPDEEITDDFRNFILNERIDYVVTYRDSVASVITHNEGEDLVLLNNCWLENGKWVNSGQSIADDWNDAQKILSKQLPEALYNLPRMAVVNNMPNDATPFVDYISTVKLSPEKFLLEMLSSHKVVVNGEYHRRKVSWDMLKRLIAMPKFPKKVGYVFMELPSWHQPTMDTFMNSDTLNANLIIQIFQDEQLNGWWDRGEYEFLCELWKINKKLPRNKKTLIPQHYYKYNFLSS